jgi:hypothetical protein
MGIETSQFHGLSVIFSGGRSGELHISGFYFKFLDEIVASLSKRRLRETACCQSAKTRPGPTSRSGGMGYLTSEVGLIDAVVWSPQGRSRHS